MGAALYIVTERQLPGFDSYFSGKALSMHERKLTRLARELGVTPLMDFFSIDPSAATEFLEDEGVDPADAELPGEKWFEAADGLASVEALRKHVEQESAAIPDSAAVLSELREFEAVLARLKAENVRWHVGVDF